MASRTAPRLQTAPWSWRKRIKTFLALVALAIATPLAVLTVFGVVLFVQVRDALPPLDDLGKYRRGISTKVYFADTDAKGQPKLMAVLATANQIPVKLEDISDHAKDATVAIEDRRFWEHKGVDYVGIGRALVRNIVGGDLRGQGASTITQQLVRNVSALGLTREKRLRRKVAEAILAMQIEQRFSKNSILELYFNQIFYGNGAIGIEAAAQAYFHKKSRDLTLGEAAFLAGIPQRPSVYANNRDAALRRRDLVLQAMVETGKITPAQRDEEVRKPLKIYRAERKGTTIYGAPYAVDHVVRRLAREFTAEEVYDGMSIYTTIDSRVQKLAEDTLRIGVRRAGIANQGALVSLEPKTGYIRAMVGGLDYRRDQFNAVTQGKRQPGSAFKPIVYTAAIDMGVCNLNSRYRDDRDFPWTRRGEKWVPKNYGGKYSNSSMTVLSAIRHSTNTIAVKVAMDVGLQAVIDYARRLGITTLDETRDRYPTLALGAAAVRPIELCSAYSVFANDGQRALPTAILRVLDSDGQVLLENAPKLVATGLREETLRAMNEALREVVVRGTGTRAAAVPEARGKTGTTSDNIDAWFAGYTPELATVVWVASEKRNKEGRVVGYKPMPGATGGVLCAPIWRDFMLGALPIVRQLNEKRTTSAAPQERAAESHRPSSQPEQPATTSQPATDIEGNPIETGPGTSTPEATPGSGAGQPVLSTPPPAGGEAPPARPSGTTIEGARAPTSLEEGPRLAEPSGRLATPSGPESGDEVISVRVCADSMRRATPYCPTTLERRIRRRDAPGPCRTHRPPPGEG